MAYEVPPLYEFGVIPNAQCRNCKHFDRRTGLRCSAYPERIPIPIQDGTFDHFTPRGGDHGVVWEPADDAPLGLPGGLTGDGKTPPVPR